MREKKIESCGGFFKTDNSFHDGQTQAFFLRQSPLLATNAQTNFARQPPANRSIGESPATPATIFLPVRNNISVTHEFFKIFITKIIYNQKRQKKLEKKEFSLVISLKFQQILQIFAKPYPTRNDSHNKTFH